MHEKRNHTNLLPVYAETRNLRIEIRKLTSLEERIVANSNTGNEMACTERDLLCLGEVLIDSLIEYHLSDRLERHQLLWPNFRRIKNVKLELVLICLWNDLYGKCPLWWSTVLNRFVQVLPVEICTKVAGECSDSGTSIDSMRTGILTSDLERLVPNETMDTKLGNPVKFDEKALPSRVHERESVNPKSLHHAIRARDPSVRHDPHNHVSG